ncbi:MAG: TIM barrel protein [Blautia marasmi]
MKISVCVDAVYAGEDIKAAIDDVLANGLDTIEFWGWEDKDIQALEEYQKEKGFRVAAFCTKFISLTDPGLRDDYVKGLEETLKIAERLNCRCLITQTGADTGRSECSRESPDPRTEGLCPASGEARCHIGSGASECKGGPSRLFPFCIREAAEIIKEVGSPNVKMLFDIYHQQITEGDLIRRIQEYLPYIGHFMRQAIRDGMSCISRRSITLMFSRQ